MFASLAALTLTLFGGSAWAAPATVDRLEVVEGEGGFGLASFEGGLVLLKANGDPHRIYKFARIKEGTPDRVRVVDVDGDGRPEVFGLGVPTFMLNKKGDPLWDVPKGCQGFALANVMGDEKQKELVCASGGAITVYTHDAQEVWSYDYGRRTVILDVGAADTADTGNEDVEFRIRGQKKGFWRISNAGEELGRDFEARETQVQDETGDYKARLADLLGGKTSFDLNGDGAGEESLKVEGAHVVIASSGKGKPLAEFDMPGGVVASAAVGDIDGDGKLEVLLGGVGVVRVVGFDGAVRADLRIDPARMQRTPVATLSGANATGLAVPHKADNIEEADEEALRELLEQKGFGAVKACYERRLKSYPLTHRGKVILKFEVDGTGKIRGQHTLYSDVTNDAVVGCISKAAKRWTVIKTQKKGAHMILDMQLGWTDTL